MEPSSFTPQVKRRLIIFGSIGLVIIILGAVGAYLILSAGRVTIDDSTIQAPLINLAPTAPGELNAVYVNEGDIVPANTPVAEVGTQILTTQVAGEIVTVNDTIGAQIGANQSVVTMIDPTQLRVVGSIDENKGLSKIQVGDAVHFTVDAFGGKEFDGVVDEIAPTSNASGVVFSISDAREEQTFDIKVRFDTTAYPQLKNGMSARMTVYP
jgi:multidrug resistance efflux pump